jgi:hypothetical protein
MQQNVDNIELLTEKVSNFQPAYNPSETRLSVQSQKEIRIKGIEALLAVTEAESVCKKAISNRNKVFKSLDPIVTRCINGLRILDVPEQSIGQGESIVRELRNVRASEIEPTSKNADGTVNEESPRTNKIRSGSFETRIENFGKLVTHLSTIEAYKPNEADLQIESLKTRLDVFKQVNSAEKAAAAKAEAARDLRDIVLSEDKTGLYDIATDSKTYVKSAYGATSTQYKSVSGILFTKKR